MIEWKELGFSSPNFKKDKLILKIPMMNMCLDVNGRWWVFEVINSKLEWIYIGQAYQN